MSRSEIYRRRRALKRECLFDRAFESLRAGVRPRAVCEETGLHIGAILRRRADKLLASGASIDSVIDAVNLGWIGLSDRAVRECTRHIARNKTYRVYLQNVDQSSSWFR